MKIFQHDYLIPYMYYFYHLLYLCTYMHRYYWLYTIPIFIYYTTLHAVYTIIMCKYTIRYASYNLHVYYKNKIYKNRI